MPAAKDFKYCDQIRDSARGAPRTIAEGFGRYRPVEFARFLEFARASLMETHNHLLDGLDQNYLSAAECDVLCTLASRAIGATTNLHAYLQTCKAPPHRRTKPKGTQTPESHNKKPGTKNREPGT
jgi:four helix bundle protein